MNTQVNTIVEAGKDLFSSVGAGTDLLSSIYKIEIRNEDKISDIDRIFCENEQALLYKSLNEIEHWYGIFARDAFKYKESHKLDYLPNGKVKMLEIRNFDHNKTDYTDYEFKPFESIDNMVDNNYNAVTAFAKTIIGYFNNTYNISVPYPKIDCDKLKIGSRPNYIRYVDLIIEHLGGRSFRDTAEEELIKRFHKAVKPGHWSKVKPELKKDKIAFPDIIRFDEFWTNKNKMHYNYRQELEDFCTGIAFGADNSLRGSTSIILQFDSNDIDVSQPYILTTTNAESIKFFKNGRIDVKFENAKMAEQCFLKAKLDEIKLREDED
jgi:hypothetical protein